MKKSFILGFIAALAFSACSNEELTTDGGVNGNGSDQKHLTVNIVSTPSSRAEVGDPDGKALYEEGTETENKVSSVRFFFFTETGAAAKVLATNNAVNYLDWAAPASDGVNMPNVEKTLEAHLVINTEKEDKIPAKIVAVLNPTSSFLTYTNGKATSLATLQGYTNNYASLANGEGEGVANRVFIMYNSIYAYGGSVIDATDIPVTAFQPSEELAKANPVNIYVERTMAKVRVRLSESTATEEKVTFVTLCDGKPAIVLKNKEQEGVPAAPIMIGEKQVYLRLSGWDVTAEKGHAYLSKRINPEWKTDLFGTSEKWNYSPYFRSYWAQNIPATTTEDGQTDNDQNYYSYDAILANGKSYENGYYYTNENAPYKEATSDMLSGAKVEPFTKVIMAGTLVCEGKDEKGNDIVEPITLCKYAGLTVAGTEALKTTLLNQIRTNGMIYSVSNEEENGVTKTVFSDIAPEDVTFTTALDSKDAATDVDESEQTQGRYYVYLILSESGAKKKWTQDNNPETENREYMSATAVNTYFYDRIGQCSVYRGGRTYYFFPIRHLGESGKVGYYGVVRNHVYDCNITKIAGLGTPVYNPGQTIWPETPIDEETYIAAKINILSWRVVPNDYKLEW